jgi:hypothetical protein
MKYFMYLSYLCFTRLEKFWHSQLFFCALGRQVLHASNPRLFVRLMFDRWFLHKSHRDRARMASGSPSRLQALDASHAACVFTAHHSSRAGCFPAVTITRKPLKCQW